MRSAATVALLMAVALTAPAFAGKPEKHKPKDKRGASAEVSVTVVFTPREREHVRTYFVERHGRGRCPPGLAKKHNGCLPPGQAKKRYVAGRALPAGVDLAPLPRDLDLRLGPPPRGYRYAIVDGDLVKLVVGTLLVVDAIDGLVN